MAGKPSAHEAELRGSLARLAAIRAFMLSISKSAHQAVDKKFLAWVQGDRTKVVEDERADDNESSVNMFTRNTKANCYHTAGMSESLW